MVFRVMADELDVAEMPLNDLQPLAVEFDRALGVRSGLLGLQVIVDRPEQLHRRIARGELALHRRADHFLLEPRRFLPVRCARVEPGGQSGRRSCTPLTEKYVQ